MSGFIKGETPHGPIRDLLPIELNNMVIKGEKLPDISFKKQRKEQDFVNTVSILPGDVMPRLDRLFDRFGEDNQSWPRLLFGEV